MEHFSPTPSPTGGRSFIDHAKVRILLAPVGGVSEQDFARWCDFVRTFETIRISDLPSSCCVKKKAATSPSGILQTGEIHLSFVTSYDPDHAFLAPFNMHRQVLGVLGLTTYSNLVNRDELEESPSALRELHPGAVVHRVFGFDSGAKRPETMDLSSMKDVVAARIEATSQGAGMTKSSSSSSISSESGFSSRKDSGLIIFPAVRKDGKDIRFYLKTLLAELVASILDSLEQIVSGLEGTPLETPRETLEGLTHNKSTASGKAGPSSTSGVGAATSRASSLFTSFGSNSSGSSSAPTSRPSSAIGAGSQTGDLGVASPLSPSPSPTAESTKAKILAANANKKSASKRVMSSGGTGPIGTGRYAKVRADYHLLSGNLWDALEGYTTSMNALGKERALAGGQDAVWFASALEGFSVARVLVSRMGGQVLEKAPCFDLPWSSGKEKEKEKEREKDGIPRPYAKHSWGEIAEAYTIALIIYAKCLAPPSVLLEPAKSVTSDTPRDYTHPLIHAAACVQYARFLLAVWASGGWNGECFDQLIYGGIPPALAEEKPSAATYLQLTSSSDIQRHDIAAAASSALTHSVPALKASDQITLLSTLTAIFGCIGFSRREAYLLRQLQNVIVTLIAKAIRFKSTQPQTSSLPLRCAADPDEVLGNIVAQISPVTVGKGPEAVLVLAMQICETYGIHVEVEPLKNVPHHHILFRATDGLRSAYASPTTNSEEWNKQQAQRKASAATAVVTPLEMQAEAPFGWKEQQISFLKETISIAEMLGDHLGMAFFAVILLRDFYPILTSDEQRDLIQGIQRAVQGARWQGAQDLVVKYWGPPEPLCSLEYVPMTENLAPSARSVKELSIVAEAQAAEGPAGLNNPFFWNPAGSASTGANDGQAIGVQNEPIAFVATLQNPFSVELEIESIRLVAEGVDFEATTERLILPPLCLQTVRLTGVSTTTGKLLVKGIALKLIGCEEELFLLPVFNEATLKERRSAATEANDRRMRLKVQGLDARSSVMKQREAQATLSTKKSSATIEHNYVECQVVPAQPIVQAYCPELQFGAVEVLEGESQTLNLILRNNSDDLAVNHFKVTFTDDLSEATKAALVESELLPQDVHELEWDLLHNPTLQLQVEGSRKQHELTIEPGAEFIVPIQVRGKLDCRLATIIVEYSHVDETTKLSGTKFWTRRLQIDFGLTVHPVLQTGPLEISPLNAAEATRLIASYGITQVKALASQPDHDLALPLPSAKPQLTGVEPGTDRSKSILEDPSSALSTADDSTYCLLSFDLTNVHLEDVMFQILLDIDEECAPLQIRRTIRAGSTTRLVLPFPRIRLSSEELRQPIPSLSSHRQFIVSKIQFSPSQELAVRKQFWLRRNLLDRIRADFCVIPRIPQNQSGSSNGNGNLFGFPTMMKRVDDDFEPVRFGRVPLGSFQIGERQAEHLCSEPLCVRLSFSSSDSSGDKETNNEGSLAAETFVGARVEILNRSGRCLKLLVRIQTISPSAIVVDATTHSIGNLEDPNSAQILFSDGNNSSVLQPWPLQDGQVGVVEKEVMFLCQGTFAFFVTVEEVTLPSTNTSIGDGANGGQDRIDQQQERISFISRITQVHVGA